MTFLRGVTIEGVCLGNNVVLDNMFHALCSISTNIMKEFLLQINTIDRLGRKVQIKDFGYINENTMHVDFQNKYLEGICLVKFQNKCGQIVVTGSDIAIERYNNNLGFSSKNNEPEVTAEPAEESALVTESPEIRREEKNIEKTEDISVESEQDELENQAISEEQPFKPEAAEVCNAEDEQETVMIEAASDGKTVGESPDLENKEKEIISKILEEAQISENIEENITNKDAVEPEMFEPVEQTIPAEEAGNEKGLNTEAQEPVEDAAPEIVLLTEDSNQEESDESIEETVVNAEDCFEPDFEEAKEQTLSPESDVQMPECIIENTEESDEEFFAEEIIEENKVPDKVLRAVMIKSPQRKKSAKSKEHAARRNDDFDEPEFDEPEVDILSKNETGKENLSDEVSKNENERNPETPEADCAAKNTEPENLVPEIEPEDYSSLSDDGADNDDIANSLADFYSPFFEKPEEQNSKNSNEKIQENNNSNTDKAGSDDLQMDKDMSLKELLDRFYKKREPALTDFGSAFKLLNSGERTEANIVNSNMFVAGNKLYKWANTIYLDR